MEIIEKLDGIVDELDQLQDYTDDLNNQLSIVDSKICDLEHFIEHNRITSKSAYRICKEMQKVLLERRKIKNDMELSRVMNINFNKIISKEHRKFLMTEMNKANGRLNKPYNNRVYTQKEQEYFLGGNYEEEISLGRDVGSMEE